MEKEEILKKLAFGISYFNDIHLAPVGVRLMDKVRELRNELEYLYKQVQSEDFSKENEGGVIFLMWK